MESRVDAASSLVDRSVSDKVVDQSPAIDVSHEDGLSEEAWFTEDINENIELDNEWKLRRDKLHTAGYREGILEGQKDAAQDGFNEGFKESVLVGYKWGIVRGVTSALAHIPDELKERLIENGEVRKDLLNLHDKVDSISTGDALKVCYDNHLREKSAPISSTNSDHLTHQSGSSGLDTYVETLESLLVKSPALYVRLSR